MGSSNNPTATITNNLGFDVDIYDVYNPNATSKVPGLLTYSNLGTVKSGASNQNVQTKRSTSTLQAMRTGSIAALNGNYYQKFPVAAMIADRFDSDAFTLTSDSQQSMEQSFKFIKYAQANPTSALAKDFATALTSSGQKVAVDTFFQGTGSFKQCSMSSWITVFNWQSQFTSAWQGTYYLYSIGDKSTPPALVATLVILSSAQANSAVLTMADSNNENVNIAMFGDGTMQDQNPGTDNLSVSLTPAWMNVTQTSQQNGKTVTNYVIGVVFTGTINGVQVTGNMNQLTLPTDSQSQDSKDCQNKANSFSLNTLFQIGGLLIGIGTLYYMAKGHKNGETQKANDAEDGAKSKADAESKRQQSEANSEVSDLPQLQNEASSVGASRPAVTEAYATVAQSQEIQAKLDLMQTQVDKLREVMEIEPGNQQIEDAADGIFDAQEGVGNAADPSMSSTEREATLSKAGSQIDTVGENLTKQLADGEIQVSEEAKQSLEQTTEAITEQKDLTESVNDAVEEKAKENEENESKDEVDENEFENEEAQGEGGEGPVEPIGE